MNPKALRCPDGKDTGDTCLSDAQINTVETAHSRFEFPFPLANGVTSYPGYNYGGEDQIDSMVNWMTGPKPPQYPLPAPADQARIWYYGSGAMRYFIARDPTEASARHHARRLQGSGAEDFRTDGFDQSGPVGVISGAAAS